MNDTLVHARSRALRRLKTIIGGTCAAALVAVSAVKDRLPGAVRQHRARKPTMRCAQWQRTSSTARRGADLG